MKCVALVYTVVKFNANINFGKDHHRVLQMVRLSLVVKYTQKAESLISTHGNFQLLWWMVQML